MRCTFVVFRQPMSGFLDPVHTETGVSGMLCQILTSGHCRIGADASEAAAWRNGKRQNRNRTEIGPPAFDDGRF